MDSLLQVFNEDEISRMLEMNSSIKDVSNSDIVGLIKILNNLGIHDNRLKNIVLSNPFYLTQDIEDVHKMIDFLHFKGLKNLGILIDTYPMILDKSSVEIDYFYTEKMNEGLSLEEVNELIETNPFMLDE